MKYALNLTEDNRILSAWVVLPNGNYDGMPIVAELPEGDITDYLYIDGEYVYDPLPAPETPEVTEPTLEDRVDTLEESSAEMSEALDMILSGVTE